MCRLSWKGGDGVYQSVLLNSSILEARRGVDCGGCDAVGGCREDAGAVEEGGMHGEGKALRRNAFSARLEVDVMLYWILNVEFSRLSCII